MLSDQRWPWRTHSENQCSFLIGHSVERNMEVDKEFYTCPVCKDSILRSKERAHRKGHQQTVKLTLAGENTVVHKQEQVIYFAQFASLLMLYWITNWLIRRRDSHVLCVKVYSKGLTTYKDTSKVISLTADPQKGSYYWKKVDKAI